MKDRDIKKMLSDGAKDVLPDEAIKEDVKRELGYAPAPVGLAEAYAGGGQTVKSVRSRNIFLVAGAAIFAVLLAVIIALSVALGRSPLAPPQLGANKFDGITDANSFYAYGAASVGNMLSSDGGQTAAAAVSAAPLSAVRAAGAAGSAAEGGDDVEIISQVNRYMSLVESLLSDSAITSSAVAGDRGYEFGMKVSYTDMLGGEVAYTMYYDKTLVDSEVDGDEVEEDYSINGVLLVGGAEYLVEGKYSTEAEEDENSSELWFRAYEDEGRDSYIEVRQENEQEQEDGKSEVERKFVYTVCENGNKSSTTVEYENEEGDTELKLTSGDDYLIFRPGKEGGDSAIFVRGRLGGSNASFRVRISQGNYHYEFDDGSSADFGRRDDDDWDDDWDDDDDHDDDRDHDDDDDRGDDRRRRGVLAALRSY